MAKRGRKSSRRRSRRSSTGNGCCPIIHVKCSMKGAGSLGSNDAYRAGYERIFGGKANATAAPAAAKAAVRSLQRRGMCTVKVGGHKAVRLNSARAGAFIARAVQAQKKRRCVPLVKRG